MSTFWTDCFPLGYPLLSRLFFHTQGAFTATAPAGSIYVRAGANGAGGFKDTAAGWGGGAAFAFAGEACSAADIFTVQVGDTAHTRTAVNDVLGDSWVKRPNSSLLVSADRGRPDGTGGLVANCTGAVKRAGSAATGSQGGSSASDDADTYPLGFGGRGASVNVSAWHGGGGGFAVGGYDVPTFPAGDGLVCVEFYSANPGYD